MLNIIPEEEGRKERKYGMGKHIGEQTLDHVRTQRNVISKLNSGDVMRGKAAGNIPNIQNEEQRCEN